MDKILEYKLIELVSKSQTTEIYRAVDKNQKKVIVKLLIDEHIDSGKLAQFRKEYEITSKLSSEWVINPQKLIKHNNSYVMILEEYGGTSLDHYIKKYAPCNNLNQLTETLKIAILIAKALNYIHNQNIIHKDLNPSNIVVNQKNSTLKIIDFGIAAELQTEQFEPIDEINFEGTYAYISPEQTGRFNRTIDYRTDFYSLGITFYELFSGILPFRADSPREWIHSHIAKEPLALNKVNSNIPQQISDIVMKLINKTVELRYQSSYGLLKDLEKCFAELSSSEQISSFNIGEFDVSQKFQIPQKLYGREKEINKLLASFNSVNQNQSACAFISGKPGIGKTSIIQEIQKHVVKNHAYFASGKFNQLERNIPYSALLQVFTKLIKSILSDSEKSIRNWQQKILQNLNGNARLIIDVIPVLEIIIGKQPELPILPASESQNRFFSSFQSFIKTFTSLEKPLVIFLDDLQWADPASLEILVNLLSNQQIGSLFLIAAYRNNEVQSNNTLLNSINQIINSGIHYKNININPLERNGIRELITDCFSFNSQDTGALTDLCLLKTHGNPFFIIEFLKSLYQNKLLYFKTKSGSWCLESDKIENLDVAENVAELLSNKIKELPAELQFILKIAACFGSKFNAKLICKITKKPWVELIQLFKKASEESFIYPLSAQYLYAEYNEEIDIEYKFSHDRVQYAIYSLISENEKEEIHQKIGKLLLQNYNISDQESLLYMVLEHLNKSVELTSDKEKIQLAELNLEACKKSKKAGAFEHALYFINKASSLITNTLWLSNYKLAFQVNFENAESLFLNGNIKEMETAINKTLPNVTNIVDKALLLEIRILSHIAQHQQPDAVKEALSILDLLGIKFPKKPGKHHIIVNLIKIILKLRKIKTVNDLQLPLMKNPAIATSMYVMAKILSASYYVNPDLFPLIVFKLLELTFKFGIAPKSPVAFVTYGLLLNALGITKRGYLFGQIGMKMFEKLNAPEHWAQAACIYNSGVSVWIEPLDHAINNLFEAYKAAIDTGDTEFAVASAAAGLSSKFHSGKDIRALNIEAKKYKNSLSYLKQKVPISQIDVLLQTFQHFIEGADKPEVLDGDFFNEHEELAHYIKMKDNASALNLYLKKMMLAYHFKKFMQAKEIAVEARKIVADVAGLLLHSDFHFYESLILLANIPMLSSTDVKNAKKRIKRNLKKLKKWTDNNSSTFENKYYLIEAELEKLKGNILLASDLYEKSIKLAKKEGFITEQALANELASEFWLSINKGEFAQIFLSNAYKLYNIWGATAKANILQKQYANLAITKEKFGLNYLNATRTTSISGTAGFRQSFDLETILDASKAISGEIILTELISKTLRIILEHAGAQQAALLINENNKELKIKAYGQLKEKEINVTLGNDTISSTNIPISLVNYAERTKEIIILHDATVIGDFTQDEYIKRNKILSAIAIPIIHQSKLLGVLYLENKLATHVFHQKRVNILTILCTQAAISMENAILFNKMEQKVTERTKEITEKNKLLHNQKQKIEQANKELTELNATKDKFFSIIAHDLRGPIGNMNTFLDLITLKIHEFNKDKLYQIITGLKETSKKTYELLNNLLIWARTQRNEIKYNPNQQSINQIINSNLSLIEQSAISKGVKIENKVNIETMAWFDTDLIDSVIRNLLNNALKYVNKNDSITITSKKNTDELIISIEDTGIGMNVKIKNNLFNIEDKQASKLGTDGERGTGLGLILCKEFINKNGGKIWVDSKENIGSTFSFSLPMKEISI